MGDRPGIPGAVGIKKRNLTAKLVIPNCDEKKNKVINLEGNGELVEISPPDESTAGEHLTCPLNQNAVGAQCM